jgi:hypothetical protein
MDLLTQHESARATRLSERTLERHRLAGTGPKFVRLGRRVFYRRDDLEAWVADCTSRSTSEADAKAERRGDAGVAIGKGSVVIRPTKKILAGIAPDDQGPDDPHPPLAGEGTPIDSERYHTLNKNSEFSSAKPDLRAGADGRVR